MFTATLMGHYIPLTWLSFGIDYTLWGMDPRGYHLTNLVLHLAAVLTFFAVALRLLPRAMTLGDNARLLAAASAALFFAIHPLRAESVAWVTERRDVLSGLLFLLSILGYLDAQASTGRRRRVLLGASVAAFAAAALSKSMVMGLPLILIVLDVYPLRRLHLGAGLLQRSRGVLLEKIPFVAIGVGCAATAYYVVKTFTPLTTSEVLPWSGRVAMVFYTLWFYVSRSVAPVALSPLYELPVEVSLWQPRFALAALTVSVTTALLIALRRRWPAGLAVWITYAVILAPISGIVHAGFQLAHDRYSYLACLGWALLLGGAVGAMAEGRISSLGPGLRRTALAAMAAWLLALGWMGWHQVQVWNDSYTLWTHAIDSDPRCAICHGNLAAHLVNNDDVAGAMRHAKEAMVLRPERPRAYATFGFALIKAGRPAAAIPYFETFLAKMPNSADGLTGLGLAMLRSGRPQQAVEPLYRAATLKPNDTFVRLNYAATLVALGDGDAAKAEYRAILANDPESVEARYAANAAGAMGGESGAVPRGRNARPR
jgi:Tfp pilus assembly protein PilF